jgi:uncharacterized membrane protein
MKKTIILPIVAVFVLAVKLGFGININEDVQQQIVDVVSGVGSLAFVLYGIFKNHKKGE